MKHLPDVVCAKCKGTGRTKLSNELLAVLTLVRKHHGGITARLVCTELDPKGSFNVTAFNNRLEDLRAFGLVTRTKRSREWVYLPARSK